VARLIGVFGGTFDPPHIGHLVLASEGLSKLGLEKVLWVLTPIPPHKQNSTITALEYRIEMLDVTLMNDPKFVLSRADIDRAPPHFTLGTMQWLEQKYPDDKFVYLMGSDSLIDLPSWHKPSEILSHCQAIGVLRRQDAELDLDALESTLPGLRSKIRYFDGPSVDISGGEIRKRVKMGAPYRYLVPHGVAEVIQRLDLYK
jgi:nicotinate-nucleotide adenylyltransferase